MTKRIPGRSQRSKGGVRVKRVLQICLLVGVCLWLIYQVKHSHDKKKEFDNKDAKVSAKAHGDDDILKLGRKDLPRMHEATKNERHREEEEDAVEEEENKPEEEVKELSKHEEVIKHQEVEHEDEEQEETNKHEEEQEEVGSKHEEEEQDEETKNEETEDERRGGGDEEMDEQDQERTKGEADREDEFVDEEKEREGEGDDRENEGNEVEEKDSQAENESSLDDHDHGDDRNTHVAREEHYKADDASSAVSHDNQIIISETEKASSENSNENTERNVLEEEIKSNNTEEINGNIKNTGIKLGEGEMAEDGSVVNVTTTDEKDNGTRTYHPEDSSLTTNISTEAVAEVSNNSKGLSTEIIVSSLQNGTETKFDSIQVQNATLDDATNIGATNLQTIALEQVNNSNTISNGNQSDSNSSISLKTENTDAASGNSFNNSEPVLSEKLVSLNATADGEVSSGSSTANTTQNGTLNSNSESSTNKSPGSSFTEGTVDANSDSESNEMNERSGFSSMNEILDAAKDDLVDSSDSSILHEDGESRMDLDTLPDIRTGVVNGEDAAAE